MTSTDLETTYADARAVLAGLAHGAATTELAAGYEQVLLQLDLLTPAPRRPLTRPAIVDRAAAYTRARALLASLVGHGVDRFEIGLCLNLLATTWVQEQPQ